jgi:hypothetical protein
MGRKNHGLIGLILGLALLAGGLAQSPAQALGAGQVPFYLNYQGRLNDKDGNPIEGTYTMTFTLYADEVGAARVWAEMQDVTVVKGMFHVLLGTLTPLDLAFDRPYWLGVKVGTDPEMRPLTRVVSVPYAFRAQDAYTVSGGIAASRQPEANKLLALNANGQFPASVIPNNAVGTAKLQDQAVTTAKLADGAVDTAKLADNAVTSAKIADETIGTDDIAPQAVTTSRIANGAVQSDQLADEAVTVAKIAPGAVTDAKISGVSASKITDQITGAQIANAAVTSDKVRLTVGTHFLPEGGTRVYNHEVGEGVLIDIPNSTTTITCSVPSVLVIHLTARIIAHHAVIYCGVWVDDQWTRIDAVGEHWDKYSHEDWNYGGGTFTAWGYVAVEPGTHTLKLKASWSGGPGAIGGVIVGAHTSYSYMLLAR